MSTKNTQLWIWSDSPLDVLLQEFSQEPIAKDFWEFALEDPGLHVSARMPSAFDLKYGFDYEVTVDFELAHSNIVEQGRQQAESLLSIMGRDDVRSATLSYDGYWLVLAKHNGLFTLTSSEWITDYEITKALRAELEASSASWSTEDFGEDTAWRVPWPV